MGWLFKCGCRRRELIEERTKDWERTTDDGMLAKTTCLAHCFRGGVGSGVLWAVWERTFVKDGQPAQPTERFITCDLLRYQRDFGWGYKDMEESMHPYYYSLSSPVLGDGSPRPVWGQCGVAAGRGGVSRATAREEEGDTELKPLLQTGRRASKRPTARQEQRRRQ